MNFRLVSIVIMIAGIISATLFFTTLAKHQPWHAALPTYSEVQPFHLTDANNQTVSLESLKGDVWVASFFFTTCSGICPIMNKNMAALHRSFALTKDVRFVSFTVNPDTDSPSVLKTYAKKFNADTNRWYFLTGPAEDIKKIAVESFKIGDIKDPVFHSAYFTLVDRQGRIRGYYDGTQTASINQLFKDIALLSASH